MRYSSIPIGILLIISLGYLGVDAARLGLADLRAEIAYKRMSDVQAPLVEKQEIVSIVEQLKLAKTGSPNDTILLSSLAKALLAEANSNRSAGAPFSDEQERGLLRAESLYAEALEVTENALYLNPLYNALWVTRAQLQYQSGRSARKIVQSMGIAVRLGAYETQVLSPMIELGVLLWYRLDANGKQVVVSAIKSALTAKRESYELEILKLLNRHAKAELICDIESLGHSYKFCR